MTIRRVLIVGSGGREHALAWRLARDPEPPALWFASGNDGMAPLGTRLDVADADGAGIVAAARDARVDLVVVGPEAPLAAGLVDALTGAGIAAFGPTRAAARLEASKAFAKEVCAAAGVPTARATTAGTLAEARAALAAFAPPWVIKADGLAAGKGVCVTRARESAEAFLRDTLEGGRFGEAGRRVVIEAFLPGEEVSVTAVCDGASFVLLPPARDHKRALDGDAGPNTGGMGAFAPVPLGAAREQALGRAIVQPVLAEMARRGSPFVGVLYAGLMLDGPRASVVEFNARFGDPETQAILPLTGGAFGELLGSAARGAVDSAAVTRRPGATVAVALVDRDYPERGSGAGRIAGLDALAKTPDVHVFVAGATREGADWRVTGGRAAWVVGEGAEVATARARAYAAIGSLGGAGWRCRQDIAATGAVTTPDDGEEHRHGG